LPLTAAVPTVVPPVVHVAGAVACGPNTVYVIVPPAEVVAPDTPALIAAAGTAVPAVPPAGAPTVRTGDAIATTVDAIPLPHPLADGASATSPP
jgi:hypothetical protein